MKCPSNVSRCHLPALVVARTTGEARRQDDPPTEAVSVGALLQGGVSGQGVLQPLVELGSDGSLVARQKQQSLRLHSRQGHADELLEESFRTMEAVVRAGPLLKAVSVVLEQCQRPHVTASVGHGLPQGRCHSSVPHGSNSTK